MTKCLFYPAFLLFCKTFVVLIILYIRFTWQLSPFEVSWYTLRKERSNRLASTALVAFLLRCIALQKKKICWRKLCWKTKYRSSTSCSVPRNRRTIAKVIRYLFTDQHRNAYSGMSISLHNKPKHHKHHKRSKSDRTKHKKLQRIDKEPEEKISKERRNF